MGTVKYRKTLPEYVNPLGVQYQVRVVEKIDDEGSVGETDGELRWIKVHQDQDSRRQWTTLLHEYIHATLHVIGIGNEMSHELEEVIVQSLEHSLEQFMLEHGRDFLRALEALK